MGKIIDVCYEGQKDPWFFDGYRLRTRNSEFLNYGIVAQDYHDGAAFIVDPDAPFIVEKDIFVVSTLKCILDALVDGGYCTVLSALSDGRVLVAFREDFLRSLDETVYNEYAAQFEEGGVCYVR